MQKATQVFSRLTEVEKINIRGAGPDRLDFLADTAHRSDLPNTTFQERSEVLQEVHALCLLEFSTKGSSNQFDGVTWKF